MLPSVIGIQVESAIKSFILNSFEMTSPLFRREGGTTAVDDFLGCEGNLTKGPYISINLPFEHQAKSYQRLSSAKPESTLVATGTGSDKTESFLYPI